MPDVGAEGVRQDRRPLTPPMWLPVDELAMPEQSAYGMASWSVGVEIVVDQRRSFRCVLLALAAFGLLCPPAGPSGDHFPPSPRSWPILRGRVRVNP
jgi:hypothetical protein